MPPDGVIAVYSHLLLWNVQILKQLIDSMKYLFSSITRGTTRA